MNKTKTRKTYLDLLRIIAILLVIYNHTSERGYYLYAMTDNMIVKVIYIAVAAFVAVGVPVFFMISGALLLGKEESIKDLYRKRVLRILIVLILASLVMACYQRLHSGTIYSIKSFVYKCLTDNICPSYWYLYSYLAFLICLPFLRVLAQHLTKEGYKYLFIIYVILEGIIPVIAYTFGITGFNMFFVIPLFERVMIFPLVGYYMENIMSDKDYNKDGLIKTIVLAAMTLIIITVMTCIRNLSIEQFTTYDKGLYTCGLTIFLDVFLFYLAKYCYIKRKNERLKQDGFISLLGGLVFGIYLGNEMILGYSYVLYDKVAPYIGRFLSAWLCVLIVFAVGGGITFILKKIPIVKKLL